MQLTSIILGQRLRDARINARLTQEEAAEAVGLTRTALLQIEAGNRAVSSLELSSLAKLYHRDVRLLLAETEREDEDLLVALCRVRSEFADFPALQREIHRYLDIFQEGIILERLLEDGVRTLAPAYELSDPRNYAEAFEQGERMAFQERKRLGLGNGPIADIAKIIAAEGVWTAVARLPDDLSGLFLHNRSIGMAVLINIGHARGRRRFSYAHEYAHALADRGRAAASVTSRGNASELVERRANAFAGEFLMPAAGVREALARLDKGGGSRETMWLWDVATELGDHVEKRNPPGSQSIGSQDVAYLAHEFMVSYDTAAYRLSDMSVVSRGELTALIERRSDGTQFIRTLKLLDPHEHEQEQPHLEGQIGRMVVEAFRRQAISSGRLLDICEKLEINGQELLNLARRAQ